MNKLNKSFVEALRVLERTPDVGRIYPLDKLPNTRELVIKYGKSGYMALYTHKEHRNLVIIHAIRHQRELRYKI